MVEDTVKDGVYQRVRPYKPSEKFIKKSCACLWIHRRLRVFARGADAGGEYAEFDDFMGRFKKEGIEISWVIVWNGLDNMSRHYDATSARPSRLYEYE